MLTPRQPFKYKVHCKQSSMRREMDCSAHLLLIILLCCAGGMSSGFSETVYGSLGSPTLLSITPEFQNLSEQFGQAVWRLGVSAQQRRPVIIRCERNSCKNYMKERIKFHPQNFSLEIQETRRTDAELYEYTVIKGPEEESLHLRLEVYERVSVPHIQVVSRTPGNESCTVTLSCGVEHGDNVTYTWDCSEGKASQQYLHNGSFMHLSLSPQKSSFTCTCNTSNPVSWQETHFSSSVECSDEPGGSLGTMHVVKYVVPACAVLICAGLVAGWLSLRDREGRSPLKEDKETCTIYSQVQRVEKQRISRPPPPVESSECSTIYVAATSLPPDTTQTHDPGLMTVYASVMPPTS